MSELEAKKASTDKQSQPQITKADMLAFRNRLVDFENESTTEVERLRRKEGLNKGEVVQATIMLAKQAVYKEIITALDDAFDLRNKGG